MAFSVTCKSCQARFLLNDDLLRRKVAGRVVTVRCRQCHETIEIDASDVDPSSLPEAEKPARPAPPAPPAGKPKGPRPAPAPPRPAKSTLMGIGAPRAAGASEMVALSAGFLDVKPADPVATTAQGFPEPPPPPEAVEVLDAGDWDEVDAAVEVKGDAAPDEAAPESLDDFAEELPPSEPPEEEMPSSTGTPSLKALTHHDEHAAPRADDFLTNMTAAMNGGIMMGAPTIDVSDLTAPPAPEQQPPTIDVSSVDAPARGAKTLPLFSTSEGTGDAPKAPAKATKSAKKGAQDASSGGSPDGSLSPATLEPRSERAVDSPRERKNVVAPARKSKPPAAASPQKASGLAAPLLLALAAAAGFLIWTRPERQPEPEVRAEAPAQQPAEAPPPTAAAPAADLAAAAAPATSVAAASPEELAFQTVPTKSPSSTLGSDKPTAAAGPAVLTPPGATLEPAPPATPKEEAKPEPTPEPAPPAEPAGPFDRAAAATALTASAAQASACRKEGDPSGVASVVVTFAPSGRVTSANLSGPPFAGTPTGGCIASALRKTKIPAFDGERMTVSKTVVIQ